VYSKNRDRILHTDIVVMFLRAICKQAENAELLSDGDARTALIALLI
jgi:hypothetical protein